MANYKTIKDKYPELGIYVDVKLNKGPTFIAKLIIRNNKFYWIDKKSILYEMSVEDLWARIRKSD